MKQRKSNGKVIIYSKKKDLPVILKTIIKNSDNYERRDPELYKSDTMTTQDKLDWRCKKEEKKRLKKYKKFWKLIEDQEKHPKKYKKKLKKREKQEKEILEFFNNYGSKGKKKKKKEEKMPKNLVAYICELEYRAELKKCLRLNNMYSDNKKYIRHNPNAGFMKRLHNAPPISEEKQILLDQLSDELLRHLNDDPFSPTNMVTDYNDDIYQRRLKKLKKKTKKQEKKDKKHNKENPYAKYII